MQSSLEHLHLNEKLFRDVIKHLKQRIHLLETGQEDVDFDLADEERASEDQATVTALRLEICLYSLCVDWVREQRCELEGVSDAAREHARANFFRLMGSVAQSELARDAHARSFGFSAAQQTDRPLTDAQMFTALEGTAERQLASLISM